MAIITSYRPRINLSMTMIVAFKLRDRIVVFSDSLMTYTDPSKAAVYDYRKVFKITSNVVIGFAGLDIPDDSIEAFTDDLKTSILPTDTAEMVVKQVPSIAKKHIRPSDTEPDFDLQVLIVGYDLAGNQKTYHFHGTKEAPRQLKLVLTGEDQQYFIGNEKYTSDNEKRAYLEKSNVSASGVQELFLKWSAQAKTDTEDKNRVGGQVRRITITRSGIKESIVADLEHFQPDN